MTPEEQIKELRDKINYHSDRYYNQDSPEISDYEFDMLMQQLKKLEKEHPELVTKDSPTQHVGGTAKRTAGVLVHHNVPMLSLQDVFSKEEVVDFVEQSMNSRNCLEKRFLQIRETAQQERCVSLTAA